jgi:hypothetical protein
MDFDGLMGRRARKIPPAVKQGCAAGLCLFFRLIFSRKTFLGEVCLKKSPTGREPFRDFGRITLSPTGPERRGQDGLARVG